TLETVTGEVDRAGVADPTPAVRVGQVPWRQLRQGWHDLPVRVGAGTYVRTQIRDRDGEIVGASNPVWLLRTPPPAGIRPPRRF
ncbi:hypothetical protein ABZS65_30280, partial [Micromonospora sp. NPDC005313]